ncbi:hypothetical protein HC928_20075 [bacterium]|nr:hypothetical protein [bacterium]
MATAAAMLLLFLVTGAGVVVLRNSIATAQAGIETRVASVEQTIVAVAYPSPTGPSPEVAGPITAPAQAATLTQAATPTQSATPTRTATTHPNRYTVSNRPRAW